MLVPRKGEILDFDMGSMALSMSNETGNERPGDYDNRIGREQLLGCQRDDEGAKRQKQDKAGWRRREERWEGDIA